MARAAEGKNCCRENPRCLQLMPSTRLTYNVPLLTQKVTGNSMETAGISRVAGAAWRVSQQRHADLGLADAPPLRLALVH